MDKNWNVRLKEKRIHAGLTLSQVSAKSNYNLSQQSLIKYEKGEVIPKVDVLENLCFIYKCDINYILYGSENTNIVISKNDYLITLWYLLVSNKLFFNGNALEILDNSLKADVNYLKIFIKRNGISSIEDIYTLLNGIRKMKDSD